MVLPQRSMGFSSDKWRFFEVITPVNYSLFAGSHVDSGTWNCNEVTIILSRAEAVNCALSSSSGYLLARKIKASDMSKTPRVECIVNSEICPGKADYLDKWVFNPDCFPCECARKSVAVVQIQTVLECWRLELEWVRMFSRRPQRNTDSEYKDTAKVHHVNYDKFFK